MIQQPFRFDFKLVGKAYRSLVHTWLAQPHVAKWFYGQGLQNTLNHLDEFLAGSSSAQYWLAYDKNHPFAFLITSLVCKPDDELTKWCTDEGIAITLDLLIGDTNYLGKMKELPYHLERFNTIPYEQILFDGISKEAFQAKELPPICPFSIFIKDQNQNVLGGVSGTSFYGSLYVDSLWIEKILRHQGWGTKLMQEAEKIGRERGARFVTVNTMDWEAFPFYEKLGYSIEFVREGYDKDSKMFMLRKNL